VGLRNARRFRYTLKQFLSRGVGKVVLLASLTLVESCGELLGEDCWSVIFQKESPPARCKALEGQSWGEDFRRVGGKG
jgi:hypothetical protein